MNSSKAFLFQAFFHFAVKKEQGLEYNTNMFYLIALIVFGPQTLLSSAFLH